MTRNSTLALHGEHVERALELVEKRAQLDRPRLERPPPASKRLTSSSCAHEPRERLRLRLERRAGSRAASR